MNTTTETKYFHYEDINGNKGTIGWRHDADVLFATIAKCSPENVFNKKIGRTIVEGRMKKLFETNSEKYGLIVTHSEVVEKIIENQDEDFFFPFLKIETSQILLTNAFNFHSYNQSMIKTLILLMFGIEEYN